MLQATSKGTDEINQETFKYPQLAIWLQDPEFEVIAPIKEVATIRVKPGKLFGTAAGEELCNAGGVFKCDCPAPFDANTAVCTIEIEIETEPRRLPNQEEFEGRRR